MREIKAFHLKTNRVRNLEAYLNKLSLIHPQPQKPQLSDFFICSYSSISAAKIMISLLEFAANLLKKIDVDEGDFKCLFILELCIDSTQLDSKSIQQKMQKPKRKRDKKKSQNNGSRKIYFCISQHQFPILNSFLEVFFFLQDKQKLQIKKFLHKC